MPTLPVLEWPVPVAAFVVGGLGVLAGRGATAWAVRLTPIEDSTGSPSRSGIDSRGGRIGGMVFGGLLFAAFTYCVFGLESQRTPMVRPSPVDQLLRFAYHLALLWLLLVATLTDLRDYVIPDSITLTGIGIGVVAAGVSGELQLAQIWLDWYQEVPGFVPPWFPPFIDTHPRWHGLACSVAGLVAGGGLVWVVRFIASTILGREAMGFGDVTLMAMVGAFVGWQPVVCALVLSPVVGVGLVLAVRLVSGRTFVPFGPYLALGTVCVLFGWRWIWLFEWPPGPDRVVSVRHLFGDAVALGMLLAISLGGLAGLCLLLRMYRAIPVGGGRIPRAGDAGDDGAESGGDDSR